MHYIEIERHDDGNVLLAWQISDALQTKIARALLTPWQNGVPIWFPNPSDVFEFWVHIGPHRWLPKIHLRCPILLVYTEYKLQPWLPPHQLILVGAHWLRGLLVIAGLASYTRLGFAIKPTAWRKFLGGHWFAAHNSAIELEQKKYWHQCIHWWD
jgi:hypothetical protein